MLDTIPAEILANIAYHVSCLASSPPVPLLQSCKSIHDALSPASNSRLYGSLFRHAFDTEAAERRLGSLHAGAVTQELKRRIKALHRIRQMVKRGDVLSVHTDDLWVVYIMLIENGMWAPIAWYSGINIRWEEYQAFPGWRHRSPQHLSQAISRTTSPGGCSSARVPGGNGRTVTGHVDRVAPVWLW
jgi:hypothetical protein